MLFCLRLVFVILPYSWHRCQLNSVDRHKCCTDVTSIAAMPPKRARHVSGAAAATAAAASNAGQWVFDARMSWLVLGVDGPPPRLPVDFVYTFSCRVQMMKTETANHCALPVSGCAVACHYHTGCIRHSARMYYAYFFLLETLVAESRGCWWLEDWKFLSPTCYCSLWQESVQLFLVPTIFFYFLPSADLISTVNNKLSM